MSITDDEIITVGTKMQNRIDKMKRKFGHLPKNSSPQIMIQRNMVELDNLLNEIDKPQYKRESKFTYNYWFSYNE